MYFSKLISFARFILIINPNICIKFNLMVKPISDENRIFIPVLKLGFRKY